MRNVFKSLIAAAAFGLIGPATATAATCVGNVVIGEGAPKVVTSVANNSVNGVCINDLIVDTLAEGANYGNHGEFVSELSKLVRKWAADGNISVKDAGELISAAGRSQIGKTITVRVLAFNDFHGNLQSPGTFGVQAGGPGTAIVNKQAGGIDYLSGYVAAQKLGYP